MLEGAVKDVATVTTAGKLLFDPIVGVQVRELTNQFTRVGGTTTECFDIGWFSPSVAIRQINHIVMQPGAISAWHFHAEQTDILFPTHGIVRVVVYDDRDASPTRGKLNVLTMGPMRPHSIVIPPGLWHGLHNIGSELAGFITATDASFEHGNPDDWRVPPDHPQIPYRFA